MKPDWYTWTTNMELDKTQPYGEQTIFGRSAPIYRQNGAVFNHNGEEINDPCIDFKKVIVAKSGKPYASVIMAELARKAKNMNDTHMIVRYNGGYGICPNQK